MRGPGPREVRSSRPTALMAGALIGLSLMSAPVLAVGLLAALPRLRETIDDAVFAFILDRFGALGAHLYWPILGVIGAALFLCFLVGAFFTRLALREMRLESRLNQSLGRRTAYDPGAGRARSPFSSE